MDECSEFDGLGCSLDLEGEEDEDGTEENWRLPAATVLGHSHTASSQLQVPCKGTSHDTNGNF